MVTWVERVTKCVHAEEDYFEKLDLARFLFDYYLLKSYIIAQLTAQSHLRAFLGKKSVRTPRSQHP